MQLNRLDVADTYLVTPQVFPDDRGHFLEMFSSPAFKEVVGHEMNVAQVNCSLSVKGTIRGLHAVSLPGQARYVTCPQGAIIDIVVDVRLGSPTYGKHVAVELSSENRHALYLAEGLAHGFAPLTDEATVVYLCSNTYAPGREVQINPFDPDLALPWPDTGAELLIADKDRTAPTLREAAERGLLPTYVECQELYAQLNGLTLDGENR
ncbi:dTDP-4-dehydrorhamnose 3,5-epimerase [Nonomuraea sp. NPDC050404]|uniref:dTDP-4-dehydrorhamnose 3,5-epimerase n=1 Tax=Nonomuraea sp. NPDC050404 TaxID=3155783 RepID=UPI00340FA2AB